MSVNPMFHSRMKHIAIDYHYVQDHVARSSFKVSHITSKDQLADALTKPLSSFLFNQIRSKIGISNGSTVLLGRVRECSETNPPISPPTLATVKTTPPISSPPLESLPQLKLIAPRF